MGQAHADAYRRAGILYKNLPRTPVLYAVADQNDTLAEQSCRRLGFQKAYGDWRRMIEDPDVDVIELRKRVGMVFQKSNPFPKSIYDNVAYGLKIQGKTRKSDLDAVVETSLRSAALWDEVKDRLHSSALGLSGGQQQRLCIARAIALESRRASGLPLKT